MVAAILERLHDSAYGQAVREVYWLFPVLEIVHFVSLCVFFGAILCVDLRLLGMARQVPLRSALQFVPIALVAFGFALVSGLGFFCNSPQDYWPNPSFKLKVLLIVIAGANALWFELIERRKLALLHAHGATPWAAKLCAGISLLAWLAVIVLGRLLPYTGTSA